VPLAIGTDAGGSSRRPPAHVGVVGFKPSYGAIPYGPGFAEPIFGISVIAPIARDVADTALAFEAMAGLDPRDPDSVEVESGQVGTSVLRIAFSPTLGLDTPIEAIIAERLEAVVGHLSGIGWRIAWRDPVWPPGATEDALMPLQHAGLATLYGADFDKNPRQFDPDTARQIERGLSWRGVDIAAALGASSAIKEAFAAFFGEFDILLAPTVPCVAWPLVQLGPSMIGGKQASPRAHAAFTPFVNHARLPAISIPCGCDATGLPFGIQIIGRRGQDRLLLRVAQRIENEIARMENFVRTVD
jgi:aspartyl-tRNA(Asn)/glutamyl-tRNA(Gln) amidotransferase subunit A